MKRHSGLRYCYLMKLVMWQSWPLLQLVQSGRLPGVVSANEPGLVSIISRSVAWCVFECVRSFGCGTQVAVTVFSCGLRVTGYGLRVAGYGCGYVAECVKVRKLLSSPSWRRRRFPCEC